MSDANSSAPKKSSIAERIAALNQNDDTPLPTLTKPTKSTGSALSARIAALQNNAESSNEPSDDVPKAEKKVGKLKKPPPGAVPIMPFGAGPPPSVIKKQKEREERMAKLQQEAKSADNDVRGNTEEEKPKVGKLKPPAGAVPIMPFGAGPPPSLLKKQKEREEQMKKLQEEANSTEEDGENGAGAASSKDVNVEDALLSRPTVKGKRRPRTRV